MFEKAHNYARLSGCNGSQFFSYDKGTIMSIIDPLACGFAKVFCYNTFANKNTYKKNSFKNLTYYKTRLVHHHCDAFLPTLSLCSQSVTYDHLKKILRKSSEIFEL